MHRRSRKAVCTCIPTPRSTTHRAVSRSPLPFPTSNSTAARKTLPCCAVFPKSRQQRTCLSLAPSAQPFLASALWKKWPPSKTSATTLTVPNTSSGKRSATAMMRDTSVCSCPVCWAVCLMARTPFRCAASTTSKASRDRTTTNTCGPTPRSPSLPTWSRASSPTAGACRSAVRSLAARSPTCPSTCTIWALAIR
ncbi:hypothetical protein D3C86_996970 [compost metagenome]